MALAVKKGTFTLAATDAGVKHIAGVGFQGKALVLFAGNGPADEAWHADLRLSMGLVDAAGAQGEAAMFDEDAVATGNSGHTNDDIACLRGMQSDGAGGVVNAYTLSFNAWEADGFALNVDLAPPADTAVHYLVLGGSDITASKLIEFTPVIAATQDVTSPGFGQPDFAFVMDAATPAGSPPASAGELAFGAFNKAAQQAVVSIGIGDNVATMQGASYQGNNEGIATPASGGLDSSGTVDVAANWPADGIHILWNDQTNSASRVVYMLWLRGTFQSKVGTDLSPTAAGNKDTDVGFTPLASMFWADAMQAHAGVLDNSSADGHGLGVGAYDGISQGVVRAQMDDAATDATSKTLSSDIDVIRQTVPGGPFGAAPATKGTATVSYAGTALRLAWVAPSAAPRPFAYLALGSAVGGGPAASGSGTTQAVAAVAAQGAKGTQAAAIVAALVVTVAASGTKGAAGTASTAATAQDVALGGKGTQGAGVTTTTPSATAAGAHTSSGTATIATAATVTATGTPTHPGPPAFAGAALVAAVAAVQASGTRAARGAATTAIAAATVTGGGVRGARGTAIAAVAAAAAAAGTKTAIGRASVPVVVTIATVGRAAGPLRFAHAHATGGSPLDVDTEGTQPMRGRLTSATPTLAATEGP